MVLFIPEKKVENIKYSALYEKQSLSLEARGKTIHQLDGLLSCNHLFLKNIEFFVRQKFAK